MERTEFCPQSGKRHSDIRTALNGLTEANYCPSCRQPLAITEVIDLTDDSPQTTPLAPVRGNAMTISSERSRPIPFTYANAHNMATESQQRSIALTARNGPITIELHAKFYIASGYEEEVVPGIFTPRYDKPSPGTAPRIFRSKIKVVLAATYLSHADMVSFLVSNFKADLAAIKWQLVSAFSITPSMYGPQEFSDAVYKTVRLRDVFEQASITLPLRVETPLNLTFFYFNKRDNSEENDTVYSSKRSIEKVESVKVEGSASKRIAKPKQGKKAKKEAIRPIKKENSIKVEVKNEGTEAIKAEGYEVQEGGNESDKESTISVAFEAFLNSTEENEDQIEEDAKEEVIEAECRPKRGTKLPERFKS